MIKRCLLMCICVVVLFSGCQTGDEVLSSNTAVENMLSVTDCVGRTVSLREQPNTVLSLSGSFSEIWLLAGGSLVGVTSDALTERSLELASDVLVLGTIREPSVEAILSAQPDFVILTQEISSHAVIADILSDADIPFYIAKVETTEDYLKVLADFTVITGNPSRFEEYGTTVKAEVDSLIAKLPDDRQAALQTALFLRAYSTDVRVKANDHTVCYILSDIGVKNIADNDGFPLEELSIEAIMEADPDYIFWVAMGDESAAVESVKQMLSSNPAWQTLTAVQNGNMIMLPKDLYHYKPNQRWGEAYAYLLKIIYPEIY